jgi:hypothetical protein
MGSVVENYSINNEGAALLLLRCTAREHISLGYPESFAIIANSGM